MKKQLTVSLAVAVLIAPGLSAGPRIPPENQQIRNSPDSIAAENIRKGSDYIIAELTLDRDGRVTTVEIKESSPPNKYDARAIEALKRWRYKPRTGKEDEAEWKTSVMIKFTPEQQPDTAATTEIQSSTPTD